MTKKEENLRIALISMESEDSDYYKNLLGDYDFIKLDSNTTIHQFKRACLDKVYSGFIIDNRTLITSTMDDKEFFFSLCEGFPVIRISRSPDSNNVNCVVEGKNMGNLKGRQLLSHFISEKCQSVAPRKVRVDNRKNIFLNTFLCFSEKGETKKTNLWDLSERGCFVITTEEKKEGDRVWLTFQELKDKTPICSEIKWTMVWGKRTSQLPGFGVSFLVITDEQKRELKETMEKSR